MGSRHDCTADRDINFGVDKNEFLFPHRVWPECVVESRHD